MKPTQLLFQVLLGIGVSVATVAIVEAIRESNAKKTLPGSGLPPGHGYA